MYLNAMSIKSLLVNGQASKSILVCCFALASLSQMWFSSRLNFIISFSRCLADDVAVLYVAGVHEQFTLQQRTISHTHMGLQTDHCLYDYPGITCKNK